MEEGTERLREPKKRKKGRERLSSGYGTANTIKAPLQQQLFAMVVRPGLPTINNRWSGTNRIPPIPAELLAAGGFMVC